MPAERSDQIEQLYHDARQRDPANRAAFLKQACAGDDALRREVESLLAEDAGVQSFLETPALEVVSKMSGDDPSQSMIGRQFGPYSVVSLLAKGGMGEVYRARDTQLQRDVALKLLPKIFASDPERLARFQREAQVLAALNHPNIAQIYGLEGTGTSRCIVMELVEGDTLEERLKRGPVPVAEALAIAQQMTQALEAAHEKDIIHRDLKPANVKITPDGRVKVLDFGLAKPLEEPLRSSSESPTFKVTATEAGLILGTAAYMSPEQARGEKVDKRTDMWAFGCVLYELLTGKQAFEGETVTDTLAAVLKTEPDWNRLPATTPASIRVLLRRCLQKDLKRRLRDATDARIEIEDALAAPPAAEAAAVALHARSTRNVWRWALVSGLACLVAAALTGIAVWNLRTPPRQAVRQLAITLPNDVPLANLDRPVVAISPDGGHLAYVAIRGGTQQIFLRALDSLESKPVEGTEGAIAPFFSPDGRWLGFFSGNSLKKISITGGASVTLCNFGAAPNGASWGANDIIAFSGSAGVGLSQVSAAGGTPQALTKVDAAKDERFHLWPQLLPGAKAVLFTVITPSQEARIAVQQLETGERKILIQGGHYGRYLPSGHLAYVRAGTLMAAPFDLKRLEVTRPAVPVVDRIMESRTGAQFSISDQGSLVYISGGASGEAKTLVWVDRKGAEQPVGAPPRPYAWPRLSPDGRLLAVALQQTDIWVYDIPRGNPSRLTFEGASTFPIWSPDGRRIAFASAREGKAPNLFWKPADGSGPDERLTTSQNLQYPATWSPDGQVIGFAEMDAATGLDLWALPLSDRKPRLFLRTPSHEFAPKFSPDGRWLAYGSNESGRPEIYVQPFPGPGGEWQISTDGGQEVLWARTGEMFYRSGNRMMAVETKTQPAFSASAPRMLFEGPYELLPNGSPNYDVTADGQRFLMVKAASPEAAPTQINVVLNWLEELKQRVPVK